MINEFMRFPGGKTKAVTFSYDDAMKSDLRLSTLFGKNGLKGTFNLCSRWIGAPGHLTVDDGKQLLADGHELAVHTANHQAPGVVSPTVGLCEMLDGRRELERLFGGIIRGMAYPNSGITQLENGHTYDEIRQYLSQVGLVYGRSLGAHPDDFRLPNDWYNWLPTAHHDDPRLPAWVDDFLQREVNSGYISARRPLLLYIWGHSYEFDQKQNWDFMQSLCEKVANRPEIWYATNMEIYTYTETYRSLEWNLDHTVCHNPTRHPVFFYANGEDYAVQPGETVSF